MSDSMAPSGASSGLGRREILVGAGAALVGLSLTPPGRSLIGELPLIGTDQAAFERPEIAARIGDTFKVVAGAAAGTVLTLTDVIAIPHQAAATDTQFAVRFASAASGALGQDTYLLKNSSFGSIPLFISPLVDAGEATHEAIIDRFVPGQQGATP